MPAFAHEVVLPVADFDGDFRAARSAHPEAIAAFEAEALEAGIAVSVKKVSFSDFDSTNPTHAGAYFIIDYTAKTELPY